MSASANFTRPVLVTGGSGFIGSHLVERLAGAGCTVVNLDLKPPHDAALERHWRRVDLSDAAGVRRAVLEAAPGVIYNLAAYASLSGDAAAMRVNTEGCIHLAEAARALPAMPLIVHASTQLTVGPGAEPPEGEFRPYSPYGESKAASERLFHAMDPAVRWIIVRPTNVWGPRHPSFADAIWKYIDRGLYLHPAGRTVIRSYGYVANVVEQLVRLAEADPARVERRTFYVGDEPVPSELWLDAFSMALRGRPVRRAPYGLLQAAALAGELSGRLGGPSPVNLGRLYRMTTDYPVPMEPTFAAVGRGPVTLEEGVARTVAWLRSGRA